MYKEQQEINQSMKGLVKNLEKSTTLLNRKLSNLPTEANEIIAPLTSQIGEVMRALKDGDSSKLGDILNKFSNL